MKELRNTASTKGSQQWIPLAVSVLPHAKEVKHKFHLEFYGKKNGGSFSELMRTLSVTGGIQGVADSVLDLANLETRREDGRQGTEGSHLCPR